MSIFHGERLTVDIFGESHGKAIGVVINGLPCGEAVDMEKLNAFLQRRSPGHSDLSTARQEADKPIFLSGVKNGVITGSPLTAVIENHNQRSSDYKGAIMRPGHADYSAFVRYGGHADMNGGGHFSGRLTAPLCIAGGIAMQILERKGISIKSHILSIGEIEDRRFCDGEDVVLPEELPVLIAGKSAEFKKKVLTAKEGGNSVGGCVECMAVGLPPGLGGMMFQSVESKLSSVLFAIPAVKGVEFGNGFDATALLGSENNDEFTYENGRVITKTNRHGGLLGGITTGMPLVVNVGFKPTPSIAKKQNTVDIAAGKDVELEIVGRHDPCIVPRAVPCVEAAMAIVALDIYN